MLIPSLGFSPEKFTGVAELIYYLHEILRQVQLRHKHERNPGLIVRTVLAEECTKVLLAERLEETPGEGRLSVLAQAQSNSCGLMLLSEQKEHLLQHWAPPAHSPLLCIYLLKNVGQQ